MMNTFLNIYFKLPHDRSFGIISKIFNRIAAKLLKNILDFLIPRYFIKTQVNFPLGINTILRDKKIIVSFTSFPERICDIWIVVECLLRQSYKPDKIILWLSRDQFKNFNLPIRLLDQQKRGLEIRFVDDDLRSHKKYFYSFQEFPEDIIITVDDDVYYHKDLIKSLVDLHLINEENIIANRAHHILFDKDTGEIKLYMQWMHNLVSSNDSYFFSPTGVGGVLYPPGSISPLIFNVPKIKEICFEADDLWLKAGSLLTNRKVSITRYFKQDFITIRGTQRIKLVSSNSLSGGNDIQLKKIFEYFKFGNLESIKD